MLNICFWNYADGKHSLMNKTLVSSLAKNGVNIDFHAFGPTDIPGAINHKLILSQEQKKHYLFKFTLLREQVIRLPYDYFIFIDADSYCVRKPMNILGCLADSPVHSFLESDCTDPKCKRPDWWGCPLPKYIEIMRERGVISKKVYNVNAGFWGVHKKAVNQFHALAMDFWSFAKNNGYTFTEEAPLAYATHMMAGDVEPHTQKNWFDLWCSDWTGNFKDKIPTGEEWYFEDYMTTEKYKVNPAIVHAMRSKDALAKGDNNV